MKLNINYQNNLEKMNKISRYEIVLESNLVSLFTPIGIGDSIGTHTDFVKIPYLVTLPGRNLLILQYANFPVKQRLRK